MFLTADQILASPIPVREVEVPEWGGTVLVRSLSPRARIAIIEVLHADRDAMTAYDEDQAKPVEDREGLSKPTAHDDSIMSVIFCVVGEDKRPLFTMEHYDRFLDLSYATIEAIYTQIRMLQMGHVPAEEQKKNSATPRKSGSSSASRSRSARR
jgi:hypothetical protein